MAATTTMCIKTKTPPTTTTITTAANRRTEQSTRQAAGIWSSTHASEREVFWTSTWARLWLSDCTSLSVCLSCLSGSLHALQYLPWLFPCLIYSVCLLSVWLCTHLIIYLPASLSQHPFLINPGVYLCASLHPSIWDKGRRGERGRWRRRKDRRGGVGLEVKGSQGTHRSACLWSLHYRIWHSARAHLISLRTHTYTHMSAHINIHTGEPERHSVCHLNSCRGELLPDKAASNTPLWI